MSLHVPNKTTAQENHTAVTLINVTKLIHPNLCIKPDFFLLHICGKVQGNVNLQYTLFKVRHTPEALKRNIGSQR